MNQKFKIHSWFFCVDKYLLCLVVGGHCFELLEGRQWLSLFLAVCVVEQSCLPGKLGTLGKP